MNAEFPKQPGPNEGAQYTDDEVTDDAESRALHDLTGQPSSNLADHHHDQETFSRDVHLQTPRISSADLTNLIELRRRKARQKKTSAGIWPIGLGRNNEIPQATPMSKMIVAPKITKAVPPTQLSQNIEWVMKTPGICY